MLEKLREKVELQSEEEASGVREISKPEIRGGSFFFFSLP